MTNITDYLKPDTPDSVRKRLMILEERGRDEAVRYYRALLSEASQQPATWLIHLNGFREMVFGDPDYWAWQGYQLTDGGWDVRLMIAPDTPLETAQELAQGLADWVKGMTQEEYDALKSHPAHGPQIEPPTENDLPF